MYQPKHLFRSTIVLIFTLIFTSNGSAHGWEIGVKVTDGTNAIAKMVCLKRVGGGYSAGHLSLTQFEGQVNWATDKNDGGPDCNLPIPTICNGPRITQTGTYRLYCEGKYQEFSFNSLSTNDIAFVYNTTTQQWSLLFNNNSLNVVGGTGTENTSCAFEE